MISFLVDTGHADDDFFDLVFGDVFGDIADWSFNWDLTEGLSNLVWIIVKDAQDVVLVVAVLTGLIDIYLCSVTPTDDEGWDGISEFLPRFEELEEPSDSASGWDGEKKDNRGKEPREDRDVCDYMKMSETEESNETDCVNDANT